MPKKKNLGGRPRHTKEWAKAKQEAEHPSVPFTYGDTVWFIYKGAEVVSGTLIRNDPIDMWYMIKFGDRVAPWLLTRHEMFKTEKDAQEALEAMRNEQDEN